MTSLLAYVGPETTVPLLSLLAVAGGVLMLIGSRIKHFCITVAKRVLQR